MDVGFYGSGLVYDDTRACHVLRRFGSSQERAFGLHAMLCHYGRGDGSLDHFRLQPGLRQSGHASW